MRHVAKTKSQSAALTDTRTCWEKLWLMKVASRDRDRGELRALPSSWGGSLEVSLTVSRSGRKKGRGGDTLGRVGAVLK